MSPAGNVAAFRETHGLSARGERVDGARRQLLARPALAVEEHVPARRRHEGEPDRAAAQTGFAARPDGVKRLANCG